MDKTSYQLWWTSADKQGQIPGGYAASHRIAADHAADFRAELLEQCSTDEERARIEAGTIEIVERES